MDAASPPPPAPNARPRSGRWLSRLVRSALGLLGTAVGLLLALLVVVLVWLRSEASLPQALAWSQRWLGSEWQLQWSGARGPLSAGGDIDWLQLRGPTLDVTIEGLRWRWADDFWSRLWRERHLALQQLKANRVTLHTAASDSGNDGLPAPPAAAALRLPWVSHVRVPLQITHLTVNDTVLVEGLEASYRYAARSTSASADAVAAAASAGSERGGATAPLTYANGPAHHALTVHRTAVLWTHPEATLHWQAAATLTVQASDSVHVALDLRGDWGAERAGLPTQHGPMRLRVTGPLDIGTTLSVSLHWRSHPTRSAPTMQLRAEGGIAPWAQWPLRTLNVQAQALDLSLLWPGAPRTRLSGTAEWTPEGDGHDGRHGRLHTRWHNAQPAPWNRGGLPLERVQLTLRHDGQALTVEALQATLGTGQLSAQGTAALPAEGGFSTASLQALSVSVRDLNPARLWAGLDATPLNATLGWQRETSAPDGRPTAASFTATLAWGSTLQARAAGQWQPGQSLHGQVSATAPGMLLDAQGALAVGGPASVATDGGALALHGRDLAALRRWLQDTTQRWQAVAPGVAQTLAQAVERLPTGDLTLHAQWGARLPLLSAPAADPWRLTLNSQRLTWTPSGAPDAKPLQLEGVQIQAEGENRHARVAARLDWPHQPHPLRLELPGLTLRWEGSAPHLKRVWTEDANVTVRAADATAHIALRQLAWDQGVLRTTGDLPPTPVAPWLPVLGWARSPETPVWPDAALALQAAWDAQLPLTAEALGRVVPQLQVSVARAAGELTLRLPPDPAAPTPAGLREAAATVRWDGRTITTRARWDSALAGHASAELEVGLPSTPSPLASLPWPPRSDAPVRGELHLHAPPLSALAPWLPAGWRVEGQIDASATLAGRWGQPVWSGTVTGEGLRFAQLAEGIDWRGGSLRAELVEQRLTVHALRLRGSTGSEADGELLLSGWAQWDAAARAPQAMLSARAQRWRPLARADRRLELSGGLTVQAQQRRLDIRGDVRVDTLRWLLPAEDTPTLGADVVVRGRTAPPEPTQWPAGWSGTVDVGVDLGTDARLSGRGLDTGLRGHLRWQQRDREPPRLVGEVQTVGGRYRAYGQSLNLSHGVLRFAGAVDNPALDLLATRTTGQQTVGIAVSGTAQAPRVRLYAEPSLPDNDILARLILGRPLSGAGAEAALVQRAALALLSARQGDGPALPTLLGLDELSVDAGGTDADGSPRAASVSLGKRLSDRLYLGYQRSVFGLVGTVSILYDLSRHLTLRAQAGDDQGVELMYQRRYD